jgi:hypothetical protein
MTMLPKVSWALLVRTDFRSDEGWEQVSAAATAENEEGFSANVEPVSDPAFRDAAPEAVRAAIPGHDEGAVTLFIADAAAHDGPGYPILVIDLWEGRPPFRCIASELWAVDNNLSIANMDWEDFADATDPDGVFRGYGE